MFTIKRTNIFIDWMKRLKDRRAVARIAVRIDRFESGNPGHVRDVGDGVSEMKIDYGRRGKTIYLLLCGGDKRTQDRDIAEAKRIAKEWTDEEN